MPEPRSAILDVVGLSPRHLGEDTPRITAFVRRGALARVRPVLPAVTCSAQSTYLTGLAPGGHGAVANGWYHRGLNEHHFWKQSNQLVEGEKLWERLRRDGRPGLTCAVLFWWYNMYSSADWAVTPRPIYPADGRKVFDVHTQPMGMREAIKADLGPFPFPAFWGPLAGLPSTEWIAAAARWVEERHAPDLSLVYLPHLDYNLQRLGPDGPGPAHDLREIDKVVGDLLDFFAGRGVRPVLLSEYGITPVDRPVHLNRAFRRRGWISVKNELGLETLDAGSSTAFAVADHQVAHIYVRRPEDVPAVREALEETEGVGAVLGGEELAAAGLAHRRSGDLVAVADARSWFTYYYWDDDALAPDFARCVDIHRKIGYDPAELFFDPATPFPKAKAALRLLQKKLGFRALMDVVPLDAGLVKGSHGRIPEDSEDWPVLAGDFPGLESGVSGETTIEADEVFGHLLAFCRRVS